MKLASEGKKVGFLVALSWLLLPQMAAFCCHPWLSFATHGILLPPMALCRHPCLSVATYGFLLPHMASFAAKGYLLQQSAFWFSVATHGFLLVQMAFCCRTWLSVATLGFLLPLLHGFLLPHMASFSAKGYLLQQSATWFSVATHGFLFPHRLSIATFGFLLPLRHGFLLVHMNFCCHTWHSTLTYKPTTTKSFDLRNVS
jgi:hypothetical protein